ncbi:hypothetical protein BSKO_05328 [Bryopsis sp. KO-2023]|nr:hypothetical protein BSKO_05328 [Bryopsis sp. KO-2023]
MAVMDAVAFSVEQPWKAFPMFMAVYGPVLLGLVITLRKRAGETGVAFGGWLVHTIKLVACGIPISFLIIAALGGHSIRLWKGNFLLAVLLSLLVGIPLTRDVEKPVQELLFARGFPLKEAHLKIPIGFTVLGAWIGAFPIPLDWDRPWQAWPVSCCLGAIGGHFAGGVVYALSQICSRHPLR